MFSRLLSGYSPESIQRAFDEFLSEGTGIPEASDIIKILREKQQMSRPEFKVFKPEESHPCYVDLSSEDQGKIDAALDTAYRVLRTPQKERRPDPAVVNHFAKMPVEIQKEIYQRLRMNVSEQQTNEAHQGDQ